MWYYTYLVCKNIAQRGYLYYCCSCFCLKEDENFRSFTPSPYNFLKLMQTYHKITVTLEKNRDIYLKEGDL